MVNSVESDTTTIWVAVIFVSTAAVSFFVNVIRDKRNRDFDAEEREKQAALIKKELAEVTKVAKEDRADIALQVKDALNVQQDKTNMQLNQQAKIVEEAIKRQEVATRPDVNSGTSQIIDAIGKIGVKTEKPNDNADQ